MDMPGRRLPPLSPQIALEMSDSRSAHLVTRPRPGKAFIDTASRPIVK